MVSDHRVICYITKWSCWVFRPNRAMSWCDHDLHLSAIPIFGVATADHSSLTSSAYWVGRYFYAGCPSMTQPSPFIQAWDRHWIALACAPQWLGVCVCVCVCVCVAHYTPGRRGHNPSSYIPYLLAARWTGARYTLRGSPICLAAPGNRTRALSVVSFSSHYQYVF